MTKRNNKIYNLVAIAIFIAFAYISSLILPIKVSFLTLDIKDAFITIGALYFGPFSAILMSLVVSLLELFFGSDTGIYGMIMNFIGSAAFSTVASLIYTRKKSLLNAITGLLCAVVCMTVVMLASNLIITPLFMAAKGMTAKKIEEMIVPLLLPFNFFKGILNAAIVMLLYKPLTIALKKAKLLEGESKTNHMNKNTIITAIGAVVILIAALIFIFIKLGGVVQ